MKKEIESACMFALADIGMKKRKSGIATISLSSDIDGWVGLNMESRFSDGTIAVNPFIGVRNHPIHKIISEIEGERFHPYLPPTVSKNIGYLTPDNTFRQYHFQPGSDFSLLARAMAGDIVKYGFPYMRLLVEHSHLRQAIERECEWVDRNERLLVLSQIGGATDAELVAFKDACISDPRAIKASVERFRVFSDKFIDYVRE